MRLRPYVEADLPALYALDQSCFPPGIAYTQAELRSFLHHPSSFSTVAAEEERTLGFAVVRPMRRMPRQTAARTPAAVLHLLTIDVDPLARRRGIGGLLMGWVLSRAAELGTAAVVLEVAVDNQPAQAFYQRLGFDRVGTIPGYYNGVTDALELERPLAMPPTL